MRSAAARGPECQRPSRSSGLRLNRPLLVIGLREDFVMAANSPSGPVATEMGREAAW